MRIQHAELRKFLGSARKMNMGGIVVVLDSKKSDVQSKETGQKTRIDYEGGQSAMCVWVPRAEMETVDEQDKILKGNELAILATDGEGPAFNRQARRPSVR